MSAVFPKSRALDHIILPIAGAGFLRLGIKGGRVVLHTVVLTLWHWLTERHRWRVACWSQALHEVRCCEQPTNVCIGESPPDRLAVKGSIALGLRLDNNHL